MLRHAHSLDIFSSNPVRGQLEPYDPTTPQDWRWLQTTETLDQFRVLLPPPTAQAYEQLLACESIELAKPRPSWEHILEIRHLKDRMIRKTQRLSPTLPPKRLGKGESFAFQTVIAPEDFRLKEMEKWLQRQSLLPKSTAANISKRHSMQSMTSKSSCCDKCSHSHRRSSSSTLITPPPPLPASEATSKKIRHLHSIPEADDRHPRPLRRVSSPAAFPSSSADEDRSRSPSPLPLRLRNSSLMLADVPTTSGSDEGSPSSADVSPPDPGNPNPPKLSRKRSALKRSSISDMVKTVSWADKGELADQIAKFADASAGGSEATKLDGIRTTYEEQMSSLEKLQSTIQSSLEHLRTEVSRLEDVEATLVEQKSVLSSTFATFEAKRLQFRDQVQKALDEGTEKEPDKDAQVQNEKVESK